MASRALLEAVDEVGLGSRSDMISWKVVFGDIEWTYALDEYGGGGNKKINVDFYVCCPDTDGPRYTLMMDTSMMGRIGLCLTPPENRWWRPAGESWPAIGGGPDLIEAIRGPFARMVEAGSSLDGLISLVVGLNSSQRSVVTLSPILHQKWLGARRSPE